MASGGAALDDLPADVQVCWTHDYTMTPYGTTWGSDGATIGGGYCWVHIHLPGSYPIANITSLTVTADACGSHGGQNVPIGAPDTGPCPPGCLQNPYTNHWNVLWPLSDKHNGDHKIAVSGTCSSFPPFGTSYTFSGDATFTISNLIVTPTQPVNPEPILWHAELGETVQLSATASAAYKALQPVKLTIYTSDQTPVKTFETTCAIGPGATQLEFEWDGSQDPPLEGVAPKGIYLFRWEVGGAGPTMDYDVDKSTLTRIVQTRSELTGTYDEATDANGIRDGCVVEDHGDPVTNPQEGRIRVFDDNLYLIADTSIANPVANPPNTPEPVWSEAGFDMVIAESECHLFAVRDGHTGSDRAHRNRWCLQMNDRKVRPLADNYCFIPDAGRVDHSAREWQKRLWDAAASYRGAYRARANGSVSAGFIMGALPSDRIMHYWGHGNAGGVTTASQMIWAKPAYSGEPGCFVTDLCLSNLKLVVWQACETALTDAVRGNIAQQAITQGAACSVGFREPVSYQERLASCARQWAFFFWQALAQGRNQNGVPSTVDDARLFAVQKVMEYNSDDPMGYDTALVFGNSAIRVVPAN